MISFPRHPAFDHNAFFGAGHGGKKCVGSHLEPSQGMTLGGPRVYTGTGENGVEGKLLHFNC